MVNQIKPPPSSFVSQGTILCCVQSADYAPNETFGVILTARCDIANMTSKGVRHLHYVPVVKIDSWLKKEGWTLVVNSEIKNIDGTINNLLKKYGLSLTAAQHIESNKFLEKSVIPTGDKVLIEKFKKRIQLTELLFNPSESKITSILTECNKTLRFILNEIVKNSKFGYYYLRHLDIDKLFGERFICLLREIYPIESSFVSNLHKGVSVKEFLKLETCDESQVYPIGQIASPDIEAIVQSFMLIFGRVGLPDRFDPGNEVNTIMEGIN